MKSKILYNWTEKDWWGKPGDYFLAVKDGLDCFAIPQNSGWNLPLQSWEIGQELGGN